eukprot:TRINITY_DN20067_c0_g2_i1.p1 TRINITY_DN20067_c0_g2~~TRINITY_DN20067_c0_g2_i1.p1  ORF type:complete len:337 (+),score=79.65 TRINITY_DN20067_c0_g2_i1:649-1659(+)
MKRAVRDSRAFFVGSVAASADAADRLRRLRHRARSALPGSKASVSVYSREAAAIPCAHRLCQRSLRLDFFAAMGQKAPVALVEDDAKEAPPTSFSAGGGNDGASPGLAKLFREEARLEELRELNRQRAQEALRRQMPQARLTKARTIDGQALLVVDNAFQDRVLSELFECLEADAFQRTEFARPDTREYRHHLVEYSVGKLAQTPLYSIVDKLVQAFWPPAEGCNPQQAYRIYTNAVMFGDVGFTHRDSSERGHVTAIVYSNPEWRHEFGGETMFYYETGEVADAVSPMPGRVCLFEGHIQHRGSPPSRLFWGSRYTTAFKFAPAPAAPRQQVGPT